MSNGRGLLHLLVFALFASACGGSSTTSDAGVETTDIGMEDAGHCDERDRDGDGVDSLACGGTDCDDDDEHRLPGNAEVCDQLDNDCDSRLDEGLDLHTCWPPCALGTVQTSPPTVDSPPTCSVCVPGAYCAGGVAVRQPCVSSEWDDDADASTVCVSRSSCIEGQFISNGGDATHDRTCAPCVEGSFSVVTNAAACTTWATCYAGEYVDALPTATNDRGCEPCAAEHFSTTLNATSCTAWRDCAPGTRASTPSPTVDRLCTLCAPGTFTADPNTVACSVHSVCEAGQVETDEPSASQDRECTPFASAMTWTRQFGTIVADEATAVATSGSDAIFVAGYTAGAMLTEQPSNNRFEAFLRRYDASGHVVWTSQFNVGGFYYQEAHAVAVDSAGDVVVAGWTGGTFWGHTMRNDDAFVRKYDSNGNVLWTQQLGTSEAEWVFAIATDDDDNIVVVGMTRGAFPSFTLAGYGDSFVAKYDSSGNLLWLQQFGTAGFTDPRAVTTDASGNVFVAGDTQGAFPGHTLLAYNDAFLRKYDADGNVVWTRQFGTDGGASVTAMAVDPSGHIILAGVTGGTFTGQTSSGIFDVFLAAYDTDGDALWTRQFGTNASDFVASLAIQSDGQIHTAGQLHYGALPGHTTSGEYDSFVTRHSSTGVLLGGRQFGTDEDDKVTGVALLGDDPILVGSTGGTLPGQNSAGPLDAYVIRMPSW